MQNITSNQKQYLWEGKTLGITITVDPVEGQGFSITEDDIVADSVSIERNWAQGDVIEIGCADTSELVFDLDNEKGQWNHVRWEGARFTVVLDINGELLQAGIFTVDERPGKLTKMQIRALDDMARFNKAYDTDLPFPATLQQILVDACAKCNVTLYTQSFDNDDYIVGEKPEGEGITYHQVVAWVAQLAGCNAWIDQMGRLQLSWYGDNQSGDLEIGPDDRFDYQLAEGDIEITGIIYRSTAGENDVDYLAGDDTYALIIEDNPLLQDGYEAVLAFLYNKIGGFTYRPYEFVVVGYPHLWPGDVITDLIDADGNELSSIITNHNYRLNGNSEIRAVGESETVRGYATGAPFTASQKRVLQSVAKVEAERQTSAIEQAALALNELMVNALGFHSTVVEGPGGGKIAYTHDQPSLEESQIIWTRTEQGFAWTDQGWNEGNPNWQYGVMSDGSMIVKLLIAVGINAEWISFAPSVNLLPDSSSEEQEFDVTIAAPITFFNLESEAVGLQPSDDVTASIELTIEFYQLRLDLIFYDSEPTYETDLGDPAVINYVSSDPIWENGRYSLTATVPEGTKIIKLVGRPYYSQTWVPGTYKELQLEKGSSATPWKPPPDPASLEGYINSIVNGTHYGGTFINGKMLYSPNVIGMTGTFKDLLAGTVDGARMELGEDAEEPFLQAFGSNNNMRVQLLKDRLNFFDEDGHSAGHISGGTLDDGRSTLLFGADAMATWPGSDFLILGRLLNSSKQQMHTIIETNVPDGGGPNGYYIRYSDGTQICWTEVNIVYVSTASLNRLWTFPVPFLSDTEPDVQLTMVSQLLRGSIPSLYFVGPLFVRHLSNTSVRPQMQSASGYSWSSEDNLYVKCKATGRWK